MNLREGIDQFRIRTMDTANPYLWPDKELAPWFSEAEAEAAVRARLIVDTKEISIGAGETGKIDLPELLFDIQYAEIISADGTVTEVFSSSRRELDSQRPGWRNRTERPTHYVHDDKSLILSSIPDQDYTLYIEFYRLPSAPMAEDEDEPEISEAHHLNLIDWVLFRAYSKPDADAFNPNKAKEAETAFVSYFGKRSNADMRRKQNANRPHRNRIHA